MSLFYLSYFAFLSIGILLVVGAAIIFFNGMVAGGKIYPANYAEIQAKDASDQLKWAEQIQEDMIPDLCQYIIFSMDGSVRSGNIDDRGKGAAWEAVKGSRSDKKGNYYMVISREDEYLVLRYQIMPQYQSSALRQYLSPPQNLIIEGTLLLILLCVACTAFCFGRELKKKLSPLLEATEKIQEQELEFVVGNSRIKEIDTILVSVEKMRTALKESLEKQWKQEQIRRDQIAALAHDLKTPLTLVRGNLELLCDTGLDAEQKVCVDYIKNSAVQMQEYVQMLIEASKSGELLPLKKETVALDLFLREVENQCKGLCAAKKLQLHWNNQCAGRMVLLDSLLFERALLNVISNAVENTPEGGSIFFDAFEKGESIRFLITDTGCGFSPEALKHATEQFYMADQSRNGKIHFGIGLTMAKSVVEQHGGRLCLENAGETGGAMVTIEVPS